MEFCRLYKVWLQQKQQALGQVLWDRNPGFLKSEIGPFSDFKEKSYLMGLKSAHFQEYDFKNRAWATDS